MKEILDLNSKTIEYYKSCFDLNGISKKTEIIQWQFFNNGMKNYVSIEFDEDAKRTTAIYASFSVNFRIGDKIVIGSQSLDTITDINYRGKGLFTKLAKDVYHKAHKGGIALIYGFPNGNSIHGFEKKLEWTVLDPLPFLIKPLKSAYFTNKIKLLRFLPNINLSLSKYSSSKNLSIIDSFSFPESVNKLWDSFSIGIKVSVQRDKSYLDWRYIQKPFENYKIAHCYDKNNNHIGFVVFVVKEKHEGKIGYIMELIYDLQHPQASKELLQYAITAIKKENADCILSWCMEHSPNAAAYKKEFFITLPEKLRPIELHFGVRTFSKEFESIISKRENWYLSYSDSDTV